MWSIYAAEYPSAIERNEALAHATTWMSPENVLLSGRSQTQKATVRFYFYEMSTLGKSVTESRLVAAGGWGEEGMGRDR